MVFFFLSAALLINGLAVADLAALLWGGGFFALTLYSLAVSLLLRFRLSRLVRRGGIAWRLDPVPSELFAGDWTQLFLTCDLPMFIPPGFRLTFRSLMYGRGGLIRAEIPLAGGETSAEVAVTTRRRGRYRGQPLLAIADLPGFCACSVALSSRTEVVFFPRPIEPRPEALPPVPTREQTERAFHLQSGGMDVRQYFPGDDPRRIGWKLYAHTGDLLLRAGTEAERPIGSALCILDTSADGGPDGFDELVSLFAGGVLQLAARGVPCMILLPNGSYPVGEDAASRRRLLRDLADVQPQTGNIPDRLPGMGVVYLFSSPGAPDKDAYVRKAAEEGREVRLVLHERRPEAAGGPRRTGWLRLVLRDTPAPVVTGQGSLPDDDTVPAVKDEVRHVRSL